MSIEVATNAWPTKSAARCHLEKDAAKNLHEGFRIRHQGLT